MRETPLKDFLEKLNCFEGRNWPQEKFTLSKCGAWPETELDLILIFLGALSIAQLSMWVVESNCV